MYREKMGGQPDPVSRFRGMKRTKLGMIGAFCVAFALSPLVATAQTSTGTSPATTTIAEEHHDYGWIGLVGLLGLAGLMGRRNDDRIRPDTTAARR